MTTKEALESIVNDGIRLDAGDYVKLEALKVAAKIIGRHIKGQLVEVVRCKGCVNYKETLGKDSGKPCGYGSCRNPCAMTGIVYDEDFCSCGERKDNDL